jgi:hypothetical protein
MQSGARSPVWSHTWVPAPHCAIRNGGALCPPAQVKLTQWAIYRATRRGDLVAYKPGGRLGTDELDLPDLTQQPIIDDRDGRHVRHMRTHARGQHVGGPLARAAASGPAPGTT